MDRVHESQSSQSEGNLSDEWGNQLQLLLLILVSILSKRGKPFRLDLAKVHALSDDKRLNPLKARETFPTHIAQSFRENWYSRSQSSQSEGNLSDISMTSSHISARLGVSILSKRGKPFRLTSNDRGRIND